MTVKEVADILEKDESTIRKIGKSLFPDAFQRGKQTDLSEAQVTAIKINLGKNSYLAKTNLEKKLIIAQGYQLLMEEIESLRPKAESYDQFIGAGNSQKMGDVAKNLGTGRNRLMAFLRDRSILMSSNVPYQNYVDAGYFEVKFAPISFGDQVQNIPVTYVTPRGEEFIRRVWLAHSIAEVTA